MKCMSSKKHLRVKNNGIFYTPEHIAMLLVAQVITRQDISILDPACGNGILLTQALRVSKQLPSKHKPYLVGCDRFKQKNLDQRIKFIHSDFFKVKTDQQFDLILTNPPYVQSARIDSKIRNRYYKKYAQPLDLSSNVDLWVYFLIKSIFHLKKGGAIAAVLPWSFLEAEYAQKIRKWFAERFGKIEVLVLQGAHFKDTVKRVLLVWLREYGVKAKSIRIGYTDKFHGELDFNDLPMKIWESENALVGLNPEINNMLAILHRSGFRPLEEYADVSIGVVTGANEYFILPKQTAKDKGFSEKSVLRILTSVEELERVISSKEMDKVLLQFARMNKRKKNYVRHGEELGLDKRVHCARRQKHIGSWYVINPDPLPDAFFTYRVSSIPYLFKNPDSYQCTNSLHKVIFKGVSENEQKWIVLSVLSLFGQLLLESKGRHYGNGIIKIEPNALKQCLVYASKKPVEQKTYAEVMQALCNGNKEKACLLATYIITREVKMRDSCVEDILKYLNKIRSLRGAKLLKQEN